MFAVRDAFYGSPSVIVDGQFIGRSSGSAVLSFGFPGFDYSESTQRACARHPSRENAAFCDGHVESPTLKSLFADTSDEALSRWNRDHKPHRGRVQ